MVNGTDHPFKFNGVELNESLGLNLYEMDFRQYDPAIARFTSIDPVTHFSNSTYNAFDNNPVFWADPSGADAIGGQSLGADGLTNDQWMNLSRPGGGGFDAMRSQASANTQYLNNLNKNASVEVGELERIGIGNNNIFQTDPNRVMAEKIAENYGGKWQDYYEFLVNHPIVERTDSRGSFFTFVGIIPGTVESFFSGSEKYVSIKSEIIDFIKNEIEELVFRECLFKGLLKTYNFRKSLILSSISFTICHFFFDGGLIYIFFGGLCLGYIYFRTRNFLLCFIAHVPVAQVNNFPYLYICKARKTIRKNYSLIFS